MKNSPFWPGFAKRKKEKFRRNKTLRYFLPALHFIDQRKKAHVCFHCCPVLFEAKELTHISSVGHHFIPDKLLISCRQTVRGFPLYES